MLFIMKSMWIRKMCTSASKLCCISIHHSNKGFLISTNMTRNC